MKHNLKFKEFFLEGAGPAFERRVLQYLEALGANMINPSMTVQQIADVLAVQYDDENFMYPARISEIERHPKVNAARRDWKARKSSFYEGTIESRIRKVGKRNPNVRDEVLEKADKPITCQVCLFNPLRMPDKYPKVNEDNAEKMFEVHHINPLSAGVRITNPIKDTIILCGNCHALWHAKQ